MSGMPFIPASASRALRAEADRHNSVVSRHARVTPEALTAVYARAITASAAPLSPAAAHSVGLARVQTYLRAVAARDTSSPDADLFPCRRLATPLTAAISLASELTGDTSPVTLLLRSGAGKRHSDPARVFAQARALAHVNRAYAPFDKVALQPALRTLLAVGGNSSLARSLRARKQLRDRKGRWIEMGGGVRFKIRAPGTPNGGVWYHGVVEGIDVPNGQIDVRLEDGRLVRIPNTKLEQPKAIIPNTDKSAPDPELKSAPEVGEDKDLEVTDSPTIKYDNTPITNDELKAAADEANEAFAPDIDSDDKEAQDRDELIARVDENIETYLGGDLSEEEFKAELYDIAATARKYGKKHGDDSFDEYADDLENIYESVVDPENDGLPAETGSDSDTGEAPVVPKSYDEPPPAADFMAQYQTIRDVWLQMSEGEARDKIAAVGNTVAFTGKHLHDGSLDRETAIDYMDAAAYNLDLAISQYLDDLPEGGEDDLTDAHTAISSLHAALQAELPEELKPTLDEIESVLGTPQNVDVHGNTPPDRYELTANSADIGGSKTQTYTLKDDPSITVRVGSTADGLPRYVAYQDDTAQSVRDNWEALDKFVDDFLLAKPDSVASGDYGQSVTMSSEATPEELEYLQGYTLNDHAMVNKLLRGSDAPQVVYYKKHVTALSSLLAKGALTEDTTLYRGTRMDFIEVSDLQVGTVLEDKGFVSTNLDKDVASNFIHGNQWTAAMLYLDVPAGTNVIDVNQVQKDGETESEAEIILPPGSRFEITSIESVEGKYPVIHAEFIGTGEDSGQAQESPAGEVDQPAPGGEDSAGGPGAEGPQESTSEEVAGESGLSPEGLYDVTIDASVVTKTDPNNLDFYDEIDNYGLQLQDEDSESPDGTTGASGYHYFVLRGTGSAIENFWDHINGGDMSNLDVTPVETDEPVESGATDHVGRALPDNFTTETIPDAPAGEGVIYRGPENYVVLPADEKGGLALVRREDGVAGFVEIGTVNDWAAVQDLMESDQTSQFEKPDTAPEDVEDTVDESDEGSTTGQQILDQIQNLSSALEDYETEDYGNIGVSISHAVDQYTDGEIDTQQLLEALSGAVEAINEVDATDDGTADDDYKNQLIGEYQTDLYGLSQDLNKAWLNGAENYDDLVGKTPAEPTEKTPAEAPDEAPAPPSGSLADVVYDVAGWQKIGGQAGYNQGGFYQAPDGTLAYVKVPDSPAHATNEVLNAALYQELGIPAGTVRLGQDSSQDGALRIVSLWVPGAVEGPEGQIKSKLNDPEFIKKAQEGFAADAWLANWDVIGPKFNNIVIGPDNTPYRIDGGGSMLFSGAGAPKGSKFGNTVGELKTLNDAGLNPNTAKVFGSMTPEDVKSSAAALLNITEDRINELVNDTAHTPEMKQYLADKLITRRKSVLDQVGLSDENPGVAPQAEVVQNIKALDEELNAPASQPAAEGKIRIAADGKTQLEIGMRVKSLKDGMTGIVVKYDPHNDYIKVKRDSDGKVLGRKTSTLMPELSHEAPALTPAESSDPATGKTAAPEVVALASGGTVPRLSADGVTPLEIGMKVVSLKDGTTGTVVKYDPHPNYIKISRDSDGKVIGRSTKTLQIVPEEVVVTTPEPPLAEWEMELLGITSPTVSPPDGSDDGTMNPSDGEDDGSWGGDAADETAAGPASKIITLEVDLIFEDDMDNEDGSTPEEDSFMASMKEMGFTVQFKNSTYGGDTYEFTGPEDKLKNWYLNNYAGDEDVFNESITAISLPNDNPETDETKFAAMVGTPTNFFVTGYEVKVGDTVYTLKSTADGGGYKKSTVVGFSTLPVYDTPLITVKPDGEEPTNIYEPDHVVWPETIQMLDDDNLPDGTVLPVNYVGSNLAIKTGDTVTETDSGTEMTVKGVTQVGDKLYVTGQSVGGFTMLNPTNLELTPAYATGPASLSTPSAINLGVGYAELPEGAIPKYKMSNKVIVQHPDGSLQVYNNNETVDKAFSQKLSSYQNSQFWHAWVGDIPSPPTSTPAPAPTPTQVLPDGYDQPPAGSVPLFVSTDTGTYIVQYPDGSMWRHNTAGKAYPASSNDPSYWQNNSVYEAVDTSKPLPTGASATSTPTPTSTLLPAGHLQPPVGSVVTHQIKPSYGAEPIYLVKYPDGTFHVHNPDGTSYPSWFASESDVYTDTWSPYTAPAAAVDTPDDASTSVALPDGYASPPAGSKALFTSNETGAIIVQHPDGKLYRYSSLGDVSPASHATNLDYFKNNPDYTPYDDGTSVTQPLVLPSAAYATPPEGSSALYKSVLTGTVIVKHPDGTLHRYPPTGSVLPTTIDEGYYGGMTGTWEPYTGEQAGSGSAPATVTEQTPPAGAPTVAGSDGKPLWAGATVIDPKGNIGVVKSIEPNGQYLKVKFADGKTLGRSRVKLKLHNAPGATPAGSQTSTSPKSATPAKSGPLGTPGPTAPASEYPDVSDMLVSGESDPTHPMYGQPKPVRPTPPPGISGGKFVSDEWMEKADENYRHSLKNLKPNWNEKPLSSSLTYSKYLAVQNGNKAQLEQLHSDGWITDELYQDASQQIQAAESTTAEALTNFNAALESYKTSLTEWTTANGHTALKLRGMSGAVELNNYDAWEWMWDNHKPGSLTPSGKLSSNAKSGAAKQKGSSSFHMSLRKTLRKESLDSSKVGQDVKNLDQAMIESPPVVEDFITIRMNGSDAFIDPTTGQPYVNHIGNNAAFSNIVGTVQHDWGFAETSPGSPKAGATPGYGSSWAVQMVIRVPKGTRGVWTAGSSHSGAGAVGSHQGERGFILERGIAYYIHKAEWKNSKWYVEAEIIPKGVDYSQFGYFTSPEFDPSIGIIPNGADGVSTVAGPSGPAL